MKYMTIGEVAAYMGVQTSTLRYYESIGILPAPERVSGQRRYSADILPVLAIIQLAKQADCTLPEIKTLLYSQDDNRKPSQRWRALAGQKLVEIEAVIAQAQAVKTLLEEALQSEALERELDECRLLR